MDETTKKLTFAIVNYFNSFCNPSNPLLSQEEKESLEVAMQCIQDVFKIDIQDEKQQRLLQSKMDLKTVFEQALNSKKGSGNSAENKIKKKEPLPNVSEEQKKKAEEFKLKGNKLVTQSNYEEAIDMYTQAIQCDPTNPVYLSNRAAAYGQQGRHDLAILDAKTALDLDPQFSKAYSRLGYAYFQLGDYTSSIEAYTQGLTLDPTNTTMQQALAQAQKKAPIVSEPSTSPTTTEEVSSSSESSPSSTGADFLNQPGFLSMAQQMLQSNPGLANLAQQFLGGGGGGGGNNTNGGRGSSNARSTSTNAGMGGSGTPDLQSLLNRPELQQMAQQAMSDPNFMQNMASMFGGGGMGGSNPKSNSRRSN